MAKKIYTGHIGAYLETETKRINVYNAHSYVEIENTPKAVVSFAMAYIEVEIPLSSEKYGPKIQVI